MKKQVIGIAATITMLAGMLMCVPAGATEPTPAIDSLFSSAMGSEGSFEKGLGNWTNIQGGIGKSNVKDGLQLMEDGGAKGDNYVKVSPLAESEGASGLAIDMTEVLRAYDKTSFYATASVKIENPNNMDNLTIIPYLRTYQTPKNGAPILVDTFSVQTLTYLSDDSGWTELAYANNPLVWLDGKTEGLEAGTAEFAVGELNSFDCAMLYFVVCAGAERDTVEEQTGYTYYIDEVQFGPLSNYPEGGAVSTDTTLPNLLKNPGFEKNGLAGWMNYYKIHTGVYDGNNTPFVELSTDVKHTGNAAVKVNPAEGSESAGWHSAIGVDLTEVLRESDNGKYFFTAWLRLAGSEKFASADAWLYFYDFERNDKQYEPLQVWKLESNEPCDSNSWTQLGLASSEAKYKYKSFQHWYNNGQTRDGKDPIAQPGDVEIRLDDFVFTHAILWVDCGMDGGAAMSYYLDDAQFWTGDFIPVNGDDEPSSSEPVQKPNESDTDVSGEDKNPETGVASYVWILFGMVAASACIISVCCRRVHNSSKR